MQETIGLQVERLLQFAYQKQMLETEDIVPCRNKLMDILSIDQPYELSEAGNIEDQQKETTQETAFDIMEPILDYCVDQGIINDSIVDRDLMDARLMGELMPRASETIRTFRDLYKQSPARATDYFYALSRNANYIQVERIKKNLYWKTATPYGNLEITINLSKPEKDPKDIAKVKSMPQTNYPKCLICKENAGFAGHANHPARQNLRLIPVNLGAEADNWYFQYSPYLYYNEHCIVLSPHHIPMKLTRDTFIRLFSFVEQFPDYFIGSNADLPIVGGSILTHDHYQGGRHTFPMEEAESEVYYTNRDFDTINISLVKWPMSVIRLSNKQPGANADQLITLSYSLLQSWQKYSDPQAGIYAYSQDTPHNTVTPIARINRNGCFEIDLVLRNNRTSEEHPYGIFHPHENLHHIKKENIGLIEVMGLAVLPARLKEDIMHIKRILTGENAVNRNELKHEEHPLHAHASWIDELVEDYGTQNTQNEARKILHEGVGHRFALVLEDAAVFKNTDEGKQQFNNFMLSCSMNLKG